MKTNSKQPNAKNLAVALLLSLSWAATASAQRVGTIFVSGRVAPVFHLEAAAPPQSEGALAASARPAGTGTLALEVSLPANSGAARVRLPLRLRSNAAFQLRARLVGEPVTGTVSVAAPRPGGAGSLLMADAVSRFAAQPVALGPEMTLASGERISAGGSFQAPANALESELEIVIDARPASGPATLTLLISLEAR